MYSWNERVICFLSLNNASYIFSSLVWLYDANRLVVPSHTFLWELNWLCSNHGVNLTI